MIVAELWDDPLENREFHETHGKWELADVGGSEPFAALIGQRLVGYALECRLGQPVAARLCFERSMVALATEAADKLFIDIEPAGR